MPSLGGRIRGGRNIGTCWGLIQQELHESGNAENLEVEKVKAHLTEDDVKSGIIGADEWRLNNEVDEDAKVAGKIQRLPQKNIDDLQRRIAISVLAHKMYVDILNRRLDDLDKLQKAFPIGDPTEYLQYLEGDEIFGDDRDPLPLGEEVVSKEVEIKLERHPTQARGGLDGDWLWGGESGHRPLQDYRNQGRG